MARFGPPDVEKRKQKQDVDRLIKSLADLKDASVRREAAEALGQLGDLADPQAVDPLIAGLNDNRLGMRHACIAFSAWFLSREERFNVLVGHKPAG